MNTDDMIHELRRLAEIHKNDRVGTGEMRWDLLCSDVANRLEEQQNTISNLTKEKN